MYYFRIKRLKTAMCIKSYFKIIAYYNMVTIYTRIK